MKHGVASNIAIVCLIGSVLLFGAIRLYHHGHRVPIPPPKESAIDQIKRWQLENPKRFIPDQLKVNYVTEAEGKAYFFLCGSDKETNDLFLPWPGPGDRWKEAVAARSEGDYLRFVKLHLKDGHITHATVDTHKQLTLVFQQHELPESEDIIFARVQAVLKKRGLEPLPPTYHPVPEEKLTASYLYAFAPFLAITCVVLVSFITVPIWVKIQALRKARRIRLSQEQHDRQLREHYENERRLREQEIQKRKDEEERQKQQEERTVAKIRADKENMRRAERESKEKIRQQVRDYYAKHQGLLQKIHPPELVDVFLRIEMSDSLSEQQLLQAYRQFVTQLHPLIIREEQAFEAARRERASEADKSLKQAKRDATLQEEIESIIEAGRKAGKTRAEIDAEVEYVREQFMTAE